LLLVGRTKKARTSRSEGREIPSGYAEYQYLDGASVGWIIEDRDF